MRAKEGTRGVIGLVHMPALPGDPRHDGAAGFQAVLDASLRDADALREGGIDQCIVENFGSAPFKRGRVDAHTIAAMTRVVDGCVSRGMSVGVNCLRNDARSALGIAAVTGAHFVRVNVLSGAYVTDQGLIEGEAHDVMRYRRAIGADHVKVFADILVKHATPLGDMPATRAAKDTAQRGLADALIVTGSGTGAGVDLDELRAVVETDTGVGVYVGSGVTPGSVGDVASLVDGIIVGTYLKEDGEVRAPVDPERVRRVVDAWRTATS